MVYAMLTETSELRVRKISDYDLFYRIFEGDTWVEGSLDDIKDEAFRTKKRFVHFFEKRVDAVDAYDQIYYIYQISVDSKESWAFKKLPTWKDENPISYEKQQISMQLGKLRRRLNIDPDVKKEIKELEERYAALEQKRLEQKNSNQV